MADRFRPETEPRKVTAKLSEGIAQVRFLTLIIEQEFFSIKSSLLKKLTSRVLGRVIVFFSRKFVVDKRRVKCAKNSISVKTFNHEKL